MLSLLLRRQVLSQRSFILEQLEERVVFDAAAAAATQDNPDNPENQDSTLQTSEAGIPAGDDATADGESSVAAAADLLSQIYSQDPKEVLISTDAAVVTGGTESADATDGDVRVLLVSSSLVGADQLAEAAPPGVITVVYDGSTDSPAEILSLIESALAGQKADSIAFAAHELGDGRFYLTGDCSVDLASLATDGQLQAFWQGIGSLLSEHGRVDLMVCNLASTAAGNGLISQLETIIGRDVAASSDPTGNADSGGDWILEDGNVDVAAAYFDSAALSQYQGILADSAPVLSLNSGAGALDLTFAGDGSLLTDFGVSSDYAYAAAIQSDGKIVVAGYAWNGSNYDIAVVRYNSDGTLDTTFGTGGKVTTGWGHNEYAYSVAIQADGKIVVAGTRVTAGGSSDFALVRYNNDGSLDTSFDTDGILVTDMGGNDVARSVTIDADGKIVVAGYRYTGSQYDIAVARYNSNGTLDSSFDGDGKVTTSWGNNEFAYSVAIQDDGKIVVAGTRAYYSGGTSYNFALVRYNSNGSLDTSFDGDGILVTDVLPGGIDVARSVAIQADGKIVVAGYAGNDLALVRYNTNGTLDTSFSGDGKLIADISGGEDKAYSVAIQSDGKIVVAGYAGDDLALARYNTNGSLDTTFDGDGILVTDLGGTDVANCVAIQSDGRIVVAGTDSNDFAVVRYDASRLAYTEGDGAQVIDNALTVSDADSETMASATIKITGNYQSGEDILGIEDGYVLPASVTAVWDAATGTLTLTGSASLAEYTAILKHVTYTNSSDDPNTAVRTVTWTVNDGTSNSVAKRSTITVAAVNEPVLSDLGGTLAYTENAPPTVIDSSVTITDPDNANMSSARIQITGNYQRGADVLGMDAGYTFPASVTAAWDETTGTLTISGLATIAEYEAMLEHVTYVNTSDAPSTADRTVTWIVNDGTVDSDPRTSVITVTAVNDAPTDITLSNYAIAENAGPNAVVGALGAIDPDSPDSHSFTLPAGVADNDLFDIVDGNLVAKDSFDYEAGATYTVHIIVTDSGGLTIEKDFTISVTNVNEPPTDMSLSNSTIAENAGANAVVGVFSATDPDSGETFTYTLVSGEGDSGNSLFNIAGNTLRANSSFDYETGPTTYSIRVKVTDSGGLSHEEQFTINVTDANEAPTLTLSNGAGALDPTFSGDGIVTTDLGGTDDQAHSVAIQSDGKIVVAGYTYNGSNYDFVVVRYNADATLDTSFGSDGIVTTDLGGTNDQAYSVAIQSDGKIVVTGCTYNGSNHDFVVVRYNTDGSLDTSFSDDGWVTSDFSGSDDQGYSVAVQSDGKIVVAGYRYDGLVYDMALARYNSDGTLDNSFDGDGKVITSWNNNEFAYSVAIQADGKIVVAGTRSFYDGSGSNDFALVRYNSDGSLDTSFDGDGILVTNMGGEDVARSLAIQSDGKIVVAGYRYDGLVYDIALARYNSDGTLDNSFDGDGKVITSWNNNEFAYSVAIQADGKIVVAGTRSFYDGSGSNDFALVRYNSDGSLDTSFDGDGILVTNLGGSDVGYSVAIQSDGKIVVAGTDSHDFGIVRYDASHLAYTENDGPRVIDGTITVTDVDSANMESATIQITGNYRNGEDVLGIEAGYVLPASVTVTWNAATGTLTLSGPASKTDYEAMLEHVTYTNNSDDPYTGTRTVTWTVNDGTSDSAAQTSTITVTPINDAPVLSGLGGTLAYTENDGPRVIDAAITLTDADSANIESASIRISGNYHSNEDRLSIDASDLAAGVTATWDAKTGTLTLKGLASTAEYETMLEHVRYTNNSDAPNAGNRTITWTVNDGSADSPGQENTITVTALNDAPELTVPGAQDMDKGSTLIISGISVSDPDVKSGTGILEVTLDVENGTIMLSSLAGITFASGDANGTGHMTFTGTLANINAALNNLQFTPFSGFSGNTVLTINVNDQGNFGAGGIQACLPGAIDITVTDITEDDGGGKPVLYDPLGSPGISEGTDGGLLASSSDLVNTILSYMTSEEQPHGHQWQEWSSQMMQEGQWDAFREHLAAALSADDQESRDRAWAALFAFIQQIGHRDTAIPLGLEDFLAKLWAQQIGMSEKFALVFNCPIIEVWDWLHSLSSSRDASGANAADVHELACDTWFDPVDGTTVTFDINELRCLDLFSEGGSLHDLGAARAVDPDSAAARLEDSDAMVFDLQKVSFLTLSSDNVQAQLDISQGVRY